MSAELLEVLVVWVPIVFTIVVLVAGVLMLTVVLPPARAQLREAKLRREIERRAAELDAGGADGTTETDVDAYADADADADGDPASGSPGTDR